MNCAHPPETTLTTAEKCVLGTLNQAWPASATMTPEAVCNRTQSDGGLPDQAAFVNLVQNLSDNGMILYEAFLMGVETGPRFLRSMITARGRAALQSEDTV